jgi:uncharacterized protein
LLHRLTLGLLLAVATAAAVDLSKLQPQGFVSDFAGVIDDRSKTELDRYARLLKERTGAELALVTIDTLDGDPVEDFTNKLFERWGVGKKGEDNGVMLLLVIKDRKSRLETGYGIEPILSAGQSGSILRAMRPALREAAYGDAFIAAANEIGNRIAQAKGVTLDGQLQPSQPRDEETGIPPIVIIIGVIALIIFLNSVSRNSGGPRMGGGVPPIWYGGGGPRWPRSGGGFGGFDSGGGGFGGFGGGSSGGGGASSNW